MHFVAARHYFTLVVSGGTGKITLQVVNGKGNKLRAYFDHAATSPMPEEVLAAYTTALRAVGNPASQHADGQRTREILEAAREKLARGMAVTPAEVIFTAGGTEAVNLGIKGLYWMRNKDAKRPVILAAMAEHNATIDTVEWLAKTQGAVVQWLPVDSRGYLSPEVLEQHILQHGAANIALLTVMWVNNEIGTVQPVPELAALAKQHGIPTHTDAVAALGHIDIRHSGVAAMSLSAHKIGGIVSSGALILARDTQVEALLHGGSQQRARSGSQDAAAATAFATAFELAHTQWDSKEKYLAQLQQRLISEIKAIDPTAVLRGATPVAPQQLQAGQRPPRVYNNVHFTFPGLQGDSLLFLLDMAGVSVSTGSACSAGVIQVSHVMTAIGLSEQEAAGAIRFSYHDRTTEAEVQLLLEALPAALIAARKAGYTVAG